MQALPRQRSDSTGFNRQVAQEFVAGETLHGLGARHGVSRSLIRVWGMKFEAVAVGEDAGAAGLLQEYEAKIAALAHMAGRPALRLVQGSGHPDTIKPEPLAQTGFKDRAPAFGLAVLRPGEGRARTAKPPWR
jgi:transposase